MKADVGPLGSPWEALGKFPKICSRALGFENLLVGSWAMSRQTGRHQNLISRVLEEERECIEKMGEKCSKVGVARRPVGARARATNGRRTAPNDDNYTGDHLY